LSSFSAFRTKSLGVLHGYLADCGPCPYLPERAFRAFLPQPNPPNLVGYRELMDQRFRRSGAHVYLPMCQGCEACRPIRLAVAGFVPREDQRRCQRRNQDLSISFHPRGSDAERSELYRRYQTLVHAKEPDTETTAHLVDDGGIPGGELHARDHTGRLLAVSVIDSVGDALSSVYCYYDPDERRRALGTCMVLAEIEYARRTGLRWLYLGFHVAGCSKMSYKARFGPAELLVNGTWRPFGGAAGDTLGVDSHHS
jgi:leucyl-tRNA---protein transferase